MADPSRHRRSYLSDPGRKVLRVSWWTVALVVAGGIALAWLLFRWLLMLWLREWPAQ